MEKSNNSKSDGTVVITSKAPKDATFSKQSKPGRSGKHSRIDDATSKTKTPSTAKTSQEKDTSKSKETTKAISSGSGNGNGGSGTNSGGTSTKASANGIYSGARDNARSTGTIILGKHRHQRATDDDWKILMWLGIFCSAVAAMFFHHNFMLNADISQDLILDYVLFFALLFMVTRFLTTAAALVVILSVAGFHFLEEIYYHKRTPPGLQGHHMRYFMVMFVVCFVVVRLFGRTNK